MNESGIHMLMRDCACPSVCLSHQHIVYTEVDATEVLVDSSRFLAYLAIVGLLLIVCDSGMMPLCNLKRSF